MGHLVGLAALVAVAALGGCRSHDAVAVDRVETPEPTERQRVWESRKEPPPPPPPRSDVEVNPPRALREYLGEHGIGDQPWRVQLVELPSGRSADVTPGLAAELVARLLSPASWGDGIKACTIEGSGQVHLMRAGARLVLTTQCGNVQIETTDGTSPGPSSHGTLSKVMTRRLRALFEEVGLEGR